MQGDEGAPHVENPEAAGGPGSPTTSQPTGATTDDNPSSGSDPADGLSEYEQRAFAGGQGAVDAVKHWQKVASGHAATVAKTKPLMASVARFGPENIVAYLDQLERFVGDPEGLRIMQQFQETGAVQVRASSQQQPNGNIEPLDDDEYLSDEEKEINSLKQRLDLYERRTLQKSASSARNELSKSFLTVFQSLGLTEDEVGDILPKIEANIAQYERTEAGVDVLEKMVGDSNSIELLVAGQLTPEKRREVYFKAHQASLAERNDVQQGYATDALPTVQTGSSREKPTAGQTAVDAARQAFAELGMDPTKPLIGQ